MSTRLFLFNTRVLTLDPTQDPRLTPDFPLTKEQYDALTVEGLMQLLREEVHADPQIDSRNPRILHILCSLLYAKGGVNCVKVHWDGYGISSRHGAVPAASLAALKQMAENGTLSEEVVDQAVWSKLVVS